jgi:hypothetical protein
MGIIIIIMIIRVVAAGAVIVVVFGDRFIFLSHVSVASYRSITPTKFKRSKYTGPR